MKIPITTRYLGAVVLFAIIHYYTVRIGLSLAYVQPNVSPVWPPSGLSLAVLLLFGLRMWPGIFLSVIIGSILEGDRIGISIGLAIANTLETVIAAKILHKLDFQNTLTRARDVIGLVFACLAATVMSAFIGSTGVSVFGDSTVPFFTLWLTWLVGNFLGCLVIAPFLLIWFTNNLLRSPRQKMLELVTLLGLLMIVTWYIFNVQPEASAFHQALIYVIFPFIIWAALRTEMVGATASIVIVSGIALYSTSEGNGPFTIGSLNDSLILLQTFLSVVTLIALLLTSITSERERAEASLRLRIKGLASLNAASRAFLDNLGKKNTYDTICQIARERFEISAVWIEKVAGAEFADFVVPPHSKEHNVQLSRSALMSNPTIWEATKKVKRNGQPVVIDSIDFQPPGLEYENCSFAALPLQNGGETFGVLCFVAPKSHTFSGDRLLLMQSYANLAAVAVHNSYLFDQVRSGNEQLHALSRRLIEIQEAERLSLSRELHDESGQILSVLMVRLGLLERDSQRPELVHDHIESLKEIVKNVLDNLHRIAVRMRPASLDRLGLISCLQQYIQDFSRQHCINVQLDAVGEEIGRLPEEVETSLYRIVQEALTNVLLHARATRVDIILSRRKDSLVTVIEDDGIGFDPGHLHQENRLGLFGMKERVQILNGRFQIESSPGKGTTIVVEVPYENSSSNRG